MSTREKRRMVREKKRRECSSANEKESNKEKSTREKRRMVREKREENAPLRMRKRVTRRGDCLQLKVQARLQGSAAKNLSQILENKEGVLQESVRRPRS